MKSDTPQSNYCYEPACIFCKIVAKQIPCKVVYEDTEVLAFHDINPSAPIHFLMIPKKHIESLSQLQPIDAVLLTKMLLLAPKLAYEQGCRLGREGGFRVLTNSGIDGGQEVFHLHIHIMGGQRPWK